MVLTTSNQDSFFFAGICADPSPAESDGGMWRVASAASAGWSGLFIIQSQGSREARFRQGHWHEFRGWLAPRVLKTSLRRRHSFNDNKGLGEGIIVGKCDMNMS